MQIGSTSRYESVGKETVVINHDRQLAQARAGVSGGNKVSMVKAPRHRFLSSRQPLLDDGLAS
jgi:hypothetical protein